VTVRLHFGIFLGVHDSGNGDSEVRDRAPEIYGNRSISLKCPVEVFLWHGNPGCPSGLSHRRMRKLEQELTR
jgi:hypothetical protein